MALRDTFLRVDLEPSVATSLCSKISYSTCFLRSFETYQTVATPYLREVSTAAGVSRAGEGEPGEVSTYLRESRTWWDGMCWANGKAREEWG